MSRHILWALTLITFTLMVMSFFMDLLRPGTTTAKGWGAMALIVLAIWFWILWAMASRSDD